MCSKSLEKVGWFFISVTELIDFVPCAWMREIVAFSSYSCKGGKWLSKEEIRVTLPPS